LAKRISAITGVKYTEYYQAMKKKNGFVWVERNLTKSQRKQILKTGSILWGEMAVKLSAM